MLVLVKMKDGTIYKGVRCGVDGGMIFLVNAWELTEDDTEELMPGDYMESPIGTRIRTGMGEEMRFIQIPVADIKVIESAK